MSDQSASTSSCEKVDCAAALRQLWDYLDGELTPDRMDAVRRHLESCKDCFPHAGFSKALLGELQALRPTERAAPSQVKARVMDALKAAGLKTAPPS